MKCFLMINTKHRVKNEQWIGTMIIASKFDALEHAMKLLPINCLQLNVNKENRKKELAPRRHIHIIRIENDRLDWNRCNSCIQFKAISPTRYRYLSLGHRKKHGLLTSFISSIYFDQVEWMCEFYSNCMNRFRLDQPFRTDTHTYSV